MATKLGTIIADFRTSLATKMAVGSTSVSLQSVTDDDGVQLPAGVYFFTIDGENSSKEHVVGDLSGIALSNIKSVSRQGVQTSGTVREHRVGASVVITNFAHIKYHNDLLDGTTDLDGDTPLKYDSDPTLSQDSELATKKYVDDVAISGGADSSSTIKGITKLSIDPDVANNPIAVGDNDSRIPTQSENDALVGSSGTPGSGNVYITEDDVAIAATASKVVRANASNKIADGYLQMTTAQATTLTDGSDADDLHVHVSGGSKLHLSPTQVSVGSTTTETSLGSFTLDGGLLNTNNGIRIEIPVSDFDMVNSYTATLRFKYGSTTICTATGSATGTTTNNAGSIVALLMSNGATNTQKGTIYLHALEKNVIDSGIDYAASLFDEGTGAEDSTGALTVEVTIQFSAALGGNHIVTEGFVATLIK